MIPRNYFIDYILEFHLEDTNTKLFFPFNF